MRYKEYYHDPKRELEMIFCYLLKQETGIEFYPNKGDVELEPPFGAVVCETAKLLNGGISGGSLKMPKAYLCNVKVMYITHIDEVDAQEHGANISIIQDTIVDFPKNDPEVSMLPLDELYGYELSEKSILDYYDELRTLSKTMANFRIHTDDPVAFARGIRQALYSVNNLGGDPSWKEDYSQFLKIGNYYEFEPDVENNVVIASIQEESKDRYIKKRPRIILNGCYLEEVSTHSDQQAFTDIFSLTVGAQEYCG